MGGFWLARPGADELTSSRVAKQQVASCAFATGTLQRRLPLRLDFRRPGHLSPALGSLVSKACNSARRRGPILSITSVGMTAR